MRKAVAQGRLAEICGQMLGDIELARARFASCYEHPERLSVETLPVKWAYWLRDTIPGCRKVIELEGTRLFFPEGRPEELAQALREHWQVKQPAATASVTAIGYLT